MPLFGPETSIAEWRVACDRIGWRPLGRVLNEERGLGHRDADWLAIPPAARRFPAAHRNSHAPDLRKSANLSTTKPTPPTTRDQRASPHLVPPQPRYKQSRNLRTPCPDRPAPIKRAPHRCDAPARR